MDKLNIEEVKSGIAQPTSPHIEITMDEIRQMVDLYVKNSSPEFKHSWKHGSLIGKDVVSSHKKILENIMYLVLDDIKEHGRDLQHANYIYEQTTSAIRNMVSIFSTSGMDVNDSKRMVIKILGYIFSLHLMQIET